MRPLSVVVLLAWVALLPRVAAESQAPATPEARAIAFLAKDLPKWRSVNGCASCHNHGDGARALALAAARGHDVGPALADALAFLQEPSRWSANKGHAADEALARLQFAAALAAAGERDLRPAEPLIAAGKTLLADQQPDGSWTPIAADAPGTPLTWGTAVATWMARSTLIASGREPDDFAVAQTDRWLRIVEPATVTDAAGVILGLGVTSDVMADKQRAQALNLIRFAQRDTGGWGHEPNAATATAFDTALVLLALQQLESDPRLARSTYRVEELGAAIDKGRAFLVGLQQPDGSWPETTRTGRPSGAQRVSTTAWALQALVSRGSR